jgi:carboxypeptidase PM20D1
MLENLQASVKIWMSNMTATFGFWINLALLLFILALLIRVIIKSAAVTWDARREIPLDKRTPDPVATNRAVNRLSGMLRFPTVTGDREAMLQQGDYIRTHYAKTLDRLGCLSLPSGSIMLRWKARERTDADPVLFCAHLDVVPAGEGWTRQPFGGATAGGKIFGRGAIDSKSVVIAMLEAVESLLAEGYAPKRDIYFAFGHDEETGGEKGAGQIAELLTRRDIHFEVIIDEGGFIVDALMEHVGRPAALIGTGEKTACTYKITVKAQGGDPSVPPRHSTVGFLAEAVCRIEAAQPRIRLLPATREYLEKCFPALSFGKRLAVGNLFISRPLLPLIFKGDQRTLSLLRSTLAPTRITGAEAENVLPSAVSALVDARLLPGESPEGILKYLQGLLADLPAEVEMVRSGETVQVTDTRHPMYQLLCRAVEEQFPLMPCIPTLLSGGTDSRHYLHMSDCVLRFSPFIMSYENAATAHGPDEYITENALGLGIELYKTLMRKL